VELSAEDLSDERERVNKLYFGHSNIVGIPSNQQEFAMFA